MIINLRGTNGSGKSTIVKRVMDLYNPMVPVTAPNRRKPIGYYNSIAKLWVVGHYETACGGADTISSLDIVYEEVRQAHLKGYHVMYEGIMASGEYRRCVELHKQFQNVTVIALDTDLNTCLDGVIERRKNRGVSEPLNPDRTVRRIREVCSMMEHLKINHVPAIWASREEAYKICLKMLGVLV